MKSALLVGVLFLATITSAQAKGTPDVEFTVHNLSVRMGGVDNPSAGYPTKEEQICIFCHTPHGGELNGPLWNHSLPGASTPGTGFTHYNSVNLSPSIRNLSATRTVGNESLLCMSCHDGSIATNRVLNPSVQGQPESVSGTPEVYIDYMPGFFFPDMKDRPGARIGGSLANPGGTADLTDDHPISFSYYDVYNDTGMDQELHTVAEAEAAGVRFFPLNQGVQAGGKRVECATCHDPHVDYDTYLGSLLSRTPASPDYGPFLVMPNTGSDLCLACHRK